MLYEPGSGRLAWHERVVIETAPRRGADAARIPNLRQTETVRERVAAIVLNDELLARYEGRAAATAAWSRIESRTTIPTSSSRPPSSPTPSPSWPYTPPDGGCARRS